MTGSAVTATSGFRFGLETLLEEPHGVHAYRPGGAEAAGGTQRSSDVEISNLSKRVSGKRIALLAHPASVDRELNHSVERLLPWCESAGGRLSALLGPQHGLRGEKQDNMVESDHYTDPETGLPVFSLYGDTRRLTESMADHFDILLFDLQDVGVRVYTFLTTLCYLLEDLQKWQRKELWVLDRPNPTGRAVEGLRLEPGWESFVGAAPVPMQHGLTLGEMALWYHAAKGLSSRLTVVPMTGWGPADPREAWPGDRVWVQPSPNMPGLYTARAYPGTVMVEGTTLSEGRGTTRPLSVVGHPEVDWEKVSADVLRECRLPGADDQLPLSGCRIRFISFQPTFHKHAGCLTPGIELVTEGGFYDPGSFRPYRLMAALFKAIRRRYPKLRLWTDPPYEYEFERRPIDVITGGSRLREWVEKREFDWQGFEETMSREEAAWRSESEPFRLYGPRSRGAGQRSGAHE